MGGQWQPIPLGATCYQPRAGATSIERLVNLYSEANEKGARYPFTLYGTPGLKPWLSVSSEMPRGLYTFGSDIYAVIGETLYAIDATSKAVTVIGTVPGAGVVRMIDNGHHVAVAASEKLFAANREEFLELPEGNMCSLTYQDGYVIFARRGTDEFWLSGLDDLTTISALDFSTADAFTDSLIGCAAINRELRLFGETSIEVWQNTGDALFPFTRAPGGVIEIGCASPGSIAKHGLDLFWLGDQANGYRVYRSAGYQPQAVSTPAIERMIADAGGQSSAEAFIYSQAGHTFYKLGFGNLTLGYDLTQGTWHERESAGDNHWRVGAHTHARGLDLVMSSDTGDIFELDLDTYDDDGDAIIRRVISPPLTDGATPLILSEAFLQLGAGEGLTSGQGSDPQAVLDWSDDDGRTWSNEVATGIGARGDYRHRATWTRLGRFRNRSLRFSISDPIKVAILGAEARIEGGV